MYQIASQTEQFWQNLTRSGGEFIDRIPTFDGNIESYFENNLELIMEEWGLVTGSDLDLISRKIDYLSYEVSRLVAERESQDERISRLKTAINELEAKR